MLQLLKSMKTIVAKRKLCRTNKNEKTDNSI